MAAGVFRRRTQTVAVSRGDFRHALDARKYELGLAHALGKEVIVMAQGSDRPPFDVSTSRLLRYDENNLTALESDLRKAFGSVSARYSYEGPQPYF